MGQLPVFLCSHFVYQTDQLVGLDVDKSVLSDQEMQIAFGEDSPTAQWGGLCLREPEKGF